MLNFYNTFPVTYCKRALWWTSRAWLGCAVWKRDGLFVHVVLRILVRNIETDLLPTQEYRTTSYLQYRWKVGSLSKLQVLKEV